MVEHIQIAKYLEDTPTWGQRDYRLYPSRYGDPFYRGRGRGRGRREWLIERPFERETNRGFGRGSSHGNRRGNGREFHSQAPSEKYQRDRQEEEWSIPASVGGRGRDIPAEQEPPHRTPPTLLPLMIDFSQIGVA